jgi:hypothetical protein
MADAPIGISFVPSAQNAQLGPQQGPLEGGGGSNSDLAQAFKILSLRLPQVLGAPSIASRRLLTAPGSMAGLPPSGFNPAAAVFQALLHASTGGSGSFMADQNTGIGMPPMPGPPVPSVKIGNTDTPSGNPTVGAGPALNPSPVLKDRRV